MNSVDHAFATDKVPWPGETIRDLLEELDMTQSEFALRLGRTQEMVSQLLNGKAPITPETAVDLERVLRVPAGFWNNAERRYRDWLTRRMEEEGLAGRHAQPSDTSRHLGAD